MYYVLDRSTLSEQELKSFNPRELPVLDCTHAFAILHYGVHGGRQLVEPTRSLPRALMRLAVLRRGNGRAALYAVRYTAYESWWAHITSELAERFVQVHGMAPGKKEL